MLSEILGEIDEIPTTSAVKPKQVINEYSALSRKLAAKNYMKSFTPPAKKVTLTKPLNKNVSKTKGILKEVQYNVDNHDKTMQCVEIENSENSVHGAYTEHENSITVDDTCDLIHQPADEFTIEDNTQADCFDDGLDMTLVDDLESQQVQDISTNEDNIANELQSEFISEWENLENENNQVDDCLLDKTDIPLVEIGDKKVS